MRGMSAQGMLPSADPESRGDYSHQRISVNDWVIAFRNIRAPRQTTGASVIFPPEKQKRI